jgi:hypothetical protein
MSYTTPPQQRNSTRKTRKAKRNEQIRALHPPFHTSSNIKLIHLHYLTPLDTMNELICKARTTTTYSMDTESKKTKPEGALVQIQMTHSKIDSTIVLLEVDYLPDHNTLLYEQIKQWCSMIFNYNNEIITWGSLEDEFKNFQFRTNLQSEFRNYHNIKNTHPTRESCETTGISYDTPGEPIEPNYETTIYYSDCKCGHHTHADRNGKWSLQDAIETEFHQFVDKSYTVNRWECGLDLRLNTWQQKWFSRRHYDAQIEKNERLNMIKYAQDDCTTVTELYFRMYPNGKCYKNNYIYETPRSITIINDKEKFDDEMSDISDEELPEVCVLHINKGGTLTTEQYGQINKGGTLAARTIDEDELSYISETELIEMLKPKFDKKPQPSSSSNIQVNQPTILSKSEKQKKKNDKYKWKKQNKPNFQNKLKRPIYYKYTFNKIKAQLLDDDVYPTHQTTINEKLLEVMITLKSKEELQRATKIVKMNYFSKKNYNDRWGK